MKVRIMRARSGYYYVQQRLQFGWRKVGGFFYTRHGARSFGQSLRHSSYNNVVEYL